MARLLLVLLVALPLLSAEIPISDVRTSTASEYTRQKLSIAGGDGFLVMWEEWYGSIYRQGTMVRPYDADGVPLRPVATELSIGTNARAVWTGNEYLVIGSANLGRWGVADVPTETVIVTRVQRDGTPVDAAQRRYLTERRAAGVLSLAWNGTQVLAVISAGDGRHLLRLDAEGNVVSDSVISANIVAVAPQGDDFFLLDGSLGVAVAEGDGWYAILGADGNVTIIDGEGTERQRVLLDTRFGPRSIAYDGSRWFVAHLDEAQRLCTSAFGRDGKVTRNCRFEPEAAEPLIAASPRRTLMAWRRAPNQIATDTGVASVRTIRQLEPDSTVDAAGLLVAWREDYEIRIGGLRHDSTRRAEHVVSPFGFKPSVVPGLVVWTGYDSAVRGRRLDAEGAPVGPVLELGVGNNAEVATTGDGWLVVYAYEPRVKTTFLTRDGIVAGMNDFGSDDVPQYRPGVAAVPDGYIVVWMQKGPPAQDEDEVEDTGYDIIAQKLSRSGLALGPQVVLGNAGSSYATGYDSTAIGCSGDRCLVVWRHQLQTYVGRYVDHSGKPITAEETFPSGDQTLQLPSAIISDVAGQLRIFRSDDGISGVETVAGRSLLVFSRGWRLFARDLLPRARAARR